jgi:hypothetical protein
LQTESSAPDAANDRERIDRARQQAESLFRPKPATPSTNGAKVNGASPTDIQRPRQPRVFRIPPVVPMAGAKAEVRATEHPAPPQAARRTTRRIPASQFGRVRALADYGMTRKQVAELYDVGVEEVDRILSRAASA